MADLKNWIGKTQSKTELIDQKTAIQMAATLDGFIDGYHIPETNIGAPLPPAWHLAWFNDALPTRELGRDSHPAKGGFLPPVKLPRRMWAGGRWTFSNPLPIGALATKQSTILSIKEKSGKSGPLCFVTVQHIISVDSHECIREEHDIVYRSNSKVRPYNDGPSAQDYVLGENEISFTPDTTLLFRYSALTFNGHRIHYDQKYTREIEGYPDLIFHGPLCATFMLQFASINSGQKPITNFSFRALRPLFVEKRVFLSLETQGQLLEITAKNHNGEIAMKATAKIGS